jgi:hypothetical protein
MAAAAVQPATSGQQGTSFYRADVSPTAIAQSVGNAPVYGANQMYTALQQAVQAISTFNNDGTRAMSQYSNEATPLSAVPASSIRGVGNPRIDTRVNARGARVDPFGRVLVLKQAFNSERDFPLFLGPNGIAPLTETNTMAWVTQKIIFNQNLPQRRSQRGRAGFSTAQTEQTSGTMLSLASAFEESYEAMDTPEGMLNFQIYLEQVTNGIIDQSIYSVLNGLLRYSSQAEELWNRAIAEVQAGQGAVSVSRIMTDENVTFAFMQKHDMPFERAMQRIRKAQAPIDGASDTLIVPAQISDFAEFNNKEYVQYYLAGSDAMRQRRAIFDEAVELHLRDISVAIVRPKIVETLAHMNFMRREEVRGDFAVLDTSPDSCNDNTAYQCWIGLYDSNQDTAWKILKLQDLIEGCPRFDANGELIDMSNKQGNWAQTPKRNTPPVDFMKRPSVYRDPFQNPTTGARINTVGEFLAAVGDSTYAIGIGMRVEKENKQTPLNAAINAAESARSRAAAAAAGGPGSVLAAVPVPARVPVEEGGADIRPAGDAAGAVQTGDADISSLVGKWKAPEAAGGTFTLTSSPLTAALVSGGKIVVNQAGELVPASSDKAAMQAVVTATNLHSTTGAHKTILAGLAAQHVRGDMNATCASIGSYLEHLRTAGVLPAELSKGQKMMTATPAEASAAVGAFKGHRGYRIAAGLQKPIGDPIDANSSSQEIAGAINAAPFNKTLLLELVKLNLPLPVKFGLIRHKIHLATYGMIACRKGDQQMLYSKPSARFSDNPHDGIVQFIATFNTGYKQLANESIYHMRNALISEVKSGWSTRFAKGGQKTNRVASNAATGDMIILMEPNASPLDSSTERITLFGRWGDTPIIGKRFTLLEEERENWQFWNVDWLRYRYNISPESASTPSENVTLYRQNTIGDMICERAGSIHPAKTGGLIGRSPAGAFSGLSFYGPGFNTTISSGIKQSKAAMVDTVISMF